MCVGRHVGALIARAQGEALEKLESLTLKESSHGPG